MANSKTKTSKRFLPAICLILIGFYVFVWLLYGLAYVNARTSLIRHYGKFVKVYPCVGGATTNVKEDLNQFDSNYIGVPVFTKPFFALKGFSYDIYYSKGGQNWEASGTVTSLGHIKETSNQQPICLLQ